MTAAALQSFIYEAEAVRVVMVGEKPWWVAADVASQLGYARSRDMVRMLADHQKGAHKVRTPGGEQDLTIISEGGLFKCILRSKRPEAEKFGDWVTDELLPTLRLTGRYEIANDVVVQHPELPDEVDALRTKLAIAREARIVFGLKQARRAWRLIGLLPELTEGLEDQSEQRHFVPPQIAELHGSVCDWMEARTKSAPGWRVEASALYRDYLSWAKEQEVEQSAVVAQVVFGRVLSNMGVAPLRSGRVFRVGLKLLDG